MKDTYELGKMEQIIFDSKIKSLIREEDEYKYIKQEDFDKLDLNESETIFIKSILDKNNILLEENLEEILPEYLWSTEKQNEMFTEYNKTHSRELLNKIFESNLPFANYMARIYSYMYENHKEAYITAQEGLFKAIQRYDVEKGTRFTTYAYRCIKGYMLSNRTEIIYYKNQGLIGEIIKVKAKIENVYGEKLNQNSENYDDMVDDIANILSINGYGTDKDKIRINKNYVIRLLNMMNYTSLDNTANIAPSYDDRLATMDKDTATVVENEYFADALYSCIDELSEFEQDVLMKRFGLKGGEAMTLDETALELADKYGKVYSGERIREVESKAVRRLRHPQRSRRLAPYL